MHLRVGCAVTFLVAFALLLQACSQDSEERTPTSPLKSPTASTLKETPSKPPVQSPTEAARIGGFTVAVSKIERTGDSALLHLVITKTDAKTAKQSTRPPKTVVMLRDDHDNTYAGSLALDFGGASSGAGGTPNGVFPVLPVGFSYSDILSVAMPEKAPIIAMRFGEGDTDIPFEKQGGTDIPFEKLRLVVTPNFGPRPDFPGISKTRFPIPIGQHLTLTVTNPEGAAVGWQIPTRVSNSDYNPTVVEINLGLQLSNGQILWTRASEPTDKQPAGRATVPGYGNVDVALRVPPFLDRLRRGYPSLFLLHVTVGARLVNELRMIPVNVTDFAPLPDRIVIGTAGLDAGAMVVIRGDGAQVMGLSAGFGPVPSPDGSRIAFSRSLLSDKTRTVRVINVDGSGEKVLRQILGLVGVDTGPILVWSPAGDRLAVLVPQMREQKANGFICSTDSAYEECVAIDAPDLKWSPDGGRIAFSRGQELFVAKADNLADERRLGPGSCFSWSPDGTQLAFERSGNIVIANANGSTQAAFVRGTCPSWSPDGKWLTYSSERNTEVADYRWKSTTLSRGYYSQSRLVSWLPDSSALIIAYVRGAASADHRCGFGLVDMATLAEKDFGGCGGSLALSPNGSRLVLESGGRIKIANRDGSGIIDTGVGRSLFQIGSFGPQWVRSVKLTEHGLVPAEGLPSVYPSSILIPPVARITEGAYRLGVPVATVNVWNSASGDMMEAALSLTVLEVFGQTFRIYSEMTVSRVGDVRLDELLLSYDGNLSFPVVAYGGDYANLGERLLADYPYRGYVEYRGVLESNHPFYYFAKGRYCIDVGCQAKTAFSITFIPDATTLPRVPSPAPIVSPSVRANKGIYSANSKAMFDYSRREFWSSAYMKGELALTMVEVLPEKFRVYSQMRLTSATSVQFGDLTDLSVRDNFGNSYPAVAFGGDYARIGERLVGGRVYAGYVEFRGVPYTSIALEYNAFRLTMSPVQGLQGAFPLLPLGRPPVFTLNTPLGSRTEERRVIVIGGLCSSTEEFNRPGHWSQVVKEWLSTEFGYRDLPSGNPDDELIEFSYSPKGWNAPYNKADTLRGITDGITNLMEIYGKAYPNARFDIISHSLGGVVTLDAMVRSPFLRERTNSIVTVDSPIRGIGDPKLIAAAVLAEPFCGARFTGEEVVGFRVWDDLYAQGPTIRQIVADSWKGLVVVNMANTKDLIVPPDRAFFPDKGYPSVWDAGPDRPLAEISFEAHGNILMDLAQRSKELIARAIRGEIPKQ